MLSTFFQSLADLARADFFTSPTDNAASFAQAASFDALADMHKQQEDMFQSQSFNSFDSFGSNF